MKLKEWKENCVVKVERFDRERVVFFLNNKKIIKNIEDVEYIKIVSPSDVKFKKVILLNELRNKFYRGRVVYQDREKISIEIDGGLKSIIIPAVKDIIDEKEFNTENSKTPLTALKWSALYPGIGQFYTYNKPLPGVLFATSFLLGWVSSIYFWRASENSYNSYKSSRYMNQKKYKEYEFNYYMMIDTFLFAAIIYVWNLFDAYFTFDQKYKVTPVNLESESQKVTNIIHPGKVPLSIDVQYSKNNKDNDIITPEMCIVFAVNYYF